MTSAPGGGVPSKADIVSNFSQGGCMNLRTGGVKKSENFADVMYGCPLSEITVTPPLPQYLAEGSCMN